MKIDSDGLSPTDIRKLMSSMIVPRPIAFISTLSERGVANVAPFSFFMGVCYSPPILAFSSTVRDGQPKDTVRNVLNTRDFVVNIVDEDIGEAMSIASADFPWEVSEFDFIGLTPAPSDLVHAPRVAEAPVNMECRLLQIVELGRPPANVSLVLGEVVRFHLRDDLYAKGWVDVRRLRALGRLSGSLYCRTGDILGMKMPTYAEVIEQGLGR